MTEVRGECVEEVNLLTCDRYPAFIILAICHRVYYT